MYFGFLWKSHPFMNFSNYFLLDCIIDIWWLPFKQAVKHFKTLSIYFSVLEVEHLFEQVLCQSLIVFCEFLEKEGILSGMAYYSHKYFKSWISKLKGSGRIESNSELFDPVDSFQHFSPQLYFLAINLNKHVQLADPAFSLIFIPDYSFVFADLSQPISSVALQYVDVLPPLIINPQ